MGPGLALQAQNVNIVCYSDYITIYANLPTCTLTFCRPLANMTDTVELHLIKKVQYRFKYTVCPSDMSFILVFCASGMILTYSNIKFL